MTNKIKILWQIIAAVFGALAGWGVIITILLNLTYYLQYEPVWLEKVVILSYCVGPAIGASVAIMLIRKIIKQVK